MEGETQTKQIGTEDKTQRGNWNIQPVTERRPFSKVYQTFTRQITNCYLMLFVCVPDEDSS